MTFNETFECLDRLAHLILRKATGSPRDLAKKLGVSLRTVHNLISQLRNWGAEIAFCRHRNTYYYLKPVNLSFSVIQTEENLLKTRGGQKNIPLLTLDAIFLHRDFASLQ